MSDSTLKRIRGVLSMIEERGGIITDVSRSKHIKVKFTNPHGKSCMLVVSVSPSDWRVEKKVITDLRKLMSRENNF